MVRRGGTVESWALCSTVTVFPAMVTVPVRTAPVFGLAVTVTLSRPAPLDGFTDRNPLLLVAVQGQPCRVDTMTENDSPAPDTRQLFRDERA